MLLSAALLKVPKDKREALAKHSGDWKAIHASFDKMAVHSICGDWKTAKGHAEAIKAASSVLRTAKGLPGAEPQAGWLSKAKTKAKVVEAAGALFEGGSNRLVGCLRELLALVGVDAKQLQPKKGSKPAKGAEGKAAKKQGKKRPSAEDDDDEDEEDMVADDLLASDDDEEMSGDDDDEDEPAEPKGKGKGGKKGGKPTPNKQEKKKQSKKQRKG